MKTYVQAFLQYFYIIESKRKTCLAFLKDHSESCLEERLEGKRLKTVRKWWESSNKGNMGALFIFANVALSI